jgi:hypothetical protein
MCPGPETVSAAYHSPFLSIGFYSKKKTVGLSTVFSLNKKRPWLGAATVLRLLYRALMQEFIQRPAPVCQPATTSFDWFDFYFPVRLSFFCSP